MKKSSPHDKYIAQAPEFARPILEKIRKTIRTACPSVEESLKWSAPHFDYEGMLAYMAAFKAHVNLGFSRGTELKDPNGLFARVGKSGMSVMRIEQLSDLPSQRVLAGFVKEAMKLNEATEKAPAKKAKRSAKAPARSIAAPDDLLAALAKKKRALATFEGFSYSNRKEYVEWITEAKRDATRASRIKTAVEWMAEGKPRNWKYMKERR